MKNQERELYNKKVNEGFPIVKPEFRDIINDATDENGDVLDHLECLLCLGIVYEPKICLNKKCERLFCSSCIKKL